LFNRQNLEFLKRLVLVQSLWRVFVDGNRPVCWMSRLGGSRHVSRLRQSAGRLFGRNPIVCLLMAVCGTSGRLRRW